MYTVCVLCPVFFNNNFILLLNSFGSVYVCVSVARTNLAGTLLHCLIHAVLFISLYVSVMLIGTDVV